MEVSACLLKLVLVCQLYQHLSDIDNCQRYLVAPETIAAFSVVFT